MSICFLNNVFAFFNFALIFFDYYGKLTIDILDSEIKVQKTHTFEVYLYCHFCNFEFFDNNIILILLLQFINSI